MANSNTVKESRKFRSLRTTLAIAFLTLSVVVLLIAGSLQIYLSFQAQQKIIAHWQQLIAQNAANAVSDFIQDKFSTLEKAATLGNLASASPEEEKLTLERLLGKEPSFRQLVLLNTQEEEVARVSRLSKLLSEQVMKYSKKELFSRVNREKTYISPVYIDEITNEPMVAIAVPVTDIFGDFKETLVAEVNLKFMWDLVSGIEIGEKGLAYVVDENGNLIAFGDVSRVLKGENLIHLKEVNKFVEGEDLSEEGRAEISKGIQDTYVLATYVSLGTPDWAVLVELPIGGAYEAMIYGIGLSILTIILCVLLTIFLSMFFSKRITEPIITLRNAAIETGKGKLETKIEIKTNDEIGELAQAFNQMVATLKEFYETLEGKVQERTEELEEARASLEIEVKARTKELEGLTERQEEIIEERTKEIKERMEELERFHRLAVGRELKMIEMKEEIERLEGTP